VGPGNRKPVVHKYFYEFKPAGLRWKISQSKLPGKDMVDLIITVCELVGPIAATTIGIILLGIALEKIRV
jgi:hypothetical protein